MTSKFWSWWTVYATSMITMGILTIHLGYGQYLLETDASYLSFVIMLLYSAIGLNIGILIFRKEETAHDALHFFSEKLMTGLGFIGTLVGIMLMFSHGADVDLSNVDAAQAYNAGILGSIGTAVQTSLFGIVAALLLQFQLAIMEN